MRRYDLDWLRVVAFALLILYHVGMFFVPWGWHIKNDVLYPELVYPMRFLHGWRLPILFVISGMGTYYALSKRSGRAFVLERLKRLLLPLAVGMLLIVPPQVYIERLHDGAFTGSYAAFWPAEAFIGEYPEGNLSWHHLWFLPYLLVYSLVLTPTFLYLRRCPGNRLTQQLRRLADRPLGLYVFLLPLYLFEALLEPFFPSTYALVGDWFNLVNYGFLFFAGFCLITIGDAFWSAVRQRRRWYLLAGAASFSLLLLIWTQLEDSPLVHFTEALVAVFNCWSWILALFGYASAYLNRPSRALAYANEAVYPFYILHQTITVVLGYYLMNAPLGFWPKAALMVLGTFGLSWLFYELLIRRWRWVRPLFGLKLPARRFSPAKGVS